MASFYIKRGSEGKVNGPLETSKLKQFAAAGKIREDDLVSQDQKKWVKASKVRGLFEEPEPEEELEDDFEEEEFDENVEEEIEEEIEEEAPKKKLRRSSRQPRAKSGRDPDNPYESPDSDVEIEEEQFEGELASRGMRLLAAILEGLIFALFLYVSIFIFGASADTQDLMSEEFWIQLGLIAMLVPIIFALLNIFFMFTQGQDIGKLILGMKIVRDDQKKIGIKEIALRYILPLLIYHVSVYMPLAGQIVVSIFLFINIITIFFNRQRKCIHDMMAGTLVIKANSQPRRSRRSKPRSEGKKGSGNKTKKAPGAKLKKPLRPKR